MNHKDHKQPSSTLAFGVHRPCGAPALAAEGAAWLLRWPTGQLLLLGAAACSLSGGRVALSGSLGPLRKGFPVMPM